MRASLINFSQRSTKYKINKSYIDFDRLASLTWREAHSSRIVESCQDIEKRPVRLSLGQLARFVALVRLKNLLQLFRNDSSVIHWYCSDKDLNEQTLTTAKCYLL